MSLHRKAARRDHTERAIIDALQAAGATVTAISAPGVPDLLVATPDGETLLMECKARRGTLTDDQRRFHERWLGRIVIARNIEDALRAIGRMD